MTAQLPDPRDFKSWEDAFQYPLPAVRKLEQQLRANGAENRERLRSLVGASYRELLGTAERICEMDEKMQIVEATLAQTAKKCNSVAVNKLFLNSASLDSEIQSRQRRDRAAAAQLAILKSCHSTISALLQRGGPPHVAAKVLVLARLLHKTLSQESSASPLVNTLRDRLAFSRAKLLKQIDRDFSNPGLDGTKLLENMCAFSLATSSVPSDALRHFLHVRLDALRNSAVNSSQSHHGMTKPIRLFKGTLTDAQAIFPRRLSDALSKLKTQPLLQDKDIQSLLELNLDIHGRWIADEVRNFTPWPRHDELQRSEAERIVKSWAPTALKTLRSVIDAILSEEKDLATVTQLRDEVVEIHLSSTSRLQGLESSEILDVLREVFNDRLRSLFDARAQSLELLSSTIKDTLKDWGRQSRDAQPSLWDLSSNTPVLDHGAAKFKSAVSDAFHGHSRVIKKCLAISAQWKDSILEAQALIKVMKERRWEDDLLDTASDTEDDLDLDSRQTLLSEDDPRELSEALASAVDAALSRFADDAEQTLAAVTDESGSQAMFLLRVVRDFTQDLAALTAASDLKTSAGMLRITSQDSVLTVPLMSRLAPFVAHDALSTFELAIPKWFEKQSRPDSLWEGHPPLPVQPSPPAFKLVYSLGKAMGRAGHDLWSTSIVRALKHHVEEHSCEVLATAVETARKLHSNVAEKRTSVRKEKHEHESSEEMSKQIDDGEDGDEASGLDGAKESDDEDEDEAAAMDPPESTVKASTPNKAEEITAKLTQVLFDVLYLERVLHVRDSASSSRTDSHSTLRSLSETLVAHLSVQEAQLEKLRKSAADYWKRTYLLLGLLA